MLYINHGKEVYMADLLPETGVRGSLQYVARGISNCKLLMTKVEGSIIRDIYLLTMVHKMYTILRGWIT